jgi:hypothetical protein
MDGVHVKQPMFHPFDALGLGIVPHFVNEQFACQATDVSST